MYTEEENRFREEVKKVAKELILPHADREADYDTIRDIYRELSRRGYLATAFPKKSGKRKGRRIQNNNGRGMGCC